MTSRVDALIIYHEMANSSLPFFIIILSTEHYHRTVITVSLCVCALVVLYMLMGVTV